MKQKEKQSPKINTPEPPQVKYPLGKPEKGKDAAKDKKLAQLNSIKLELLFAHSSLFFIVD